MYKVKTLCVLLSCLFCLSAARPIVRSIKSTHEFDRLLKKHATETGLPVVVDFYSDGCGPCRMMAPIFKKVAKDFADKAVFVKIDTNSQYELSSRYRIQSLPTFAWFIGGNKIQQEVGGIGEGPLRQYTEKAIRQAEGENIKLELDSLKAFYAEVDPTKAEADIENVYSKCTDLKKKKTEFCQGPAAQNLVRKLKKKYKKAPATTTLFEPQPSSKTQAGEEEKEKKTTDKTEQKPSKPSKSNTPNLHLATKEQLMEELEKRLDEERDQEIESEDVEEEDALDDNHSRWIPGPFPERVVIVGGGPAGLASAVYAARAGLTPLVIAPSMGGQLQGKGVDVENYPGLHNMTGPAVIASMRSQAAHFGAVFEEDIVVSIDASSRPLKVVTNSTGAIETHSIIVATGADSKWLGIPGEYELRGGGVSSCATCDGFLFSGRHVVVVGGGDAAMEDALVLSRTSKKVTLIHRRDAFRASKVLADRVKSHPLIEIQWNTVLEKIEGKALPSQNEGEEVDLDGPVDMIVSGVVLKDVTTGETRNMDCDAVFVAIGHLPNTNFLEGVVEFDPEHPGYVKTFGQTTKTSVPGIFAAGDVSDAVYRQAITSAGSGAAAALDAERYLSEEGLGNEATELEAELMAELAGEMAENASEEKLGYNAYEDAGGRVHGIRESVGAEL
ncbi:thioredoxin reductase [Nitzschia inconspicua]|uniref:Thioredoxin reductase n=1 Tax=Nitzschia inconspicua TaxID=303405 RepID=A0A9K3LTU9_9STRA|nr:thioredoxin reductase [Nitzschia inconspicua]KAG7366526.1 thioredoxin reductase [Nitzschia inconspicua]